MASLRGKSIFLMIILSVSMLSMVSTPPTHENPVTQYTDTDNIGAPTSSQEQPSVPSEPVQLQTTPESSTELPSSVVSSSQTTTTWAEVDHFFPKSQYPSSTPVRLTSDDKLQMMISLRDSSTVDQLGSSLLFEQLDIVDYLPSAHLLVVNVPLRTQATNNLLSTGQLLDQLESQSTITSVEPDFAINTDLTPDDPKWSNQWGPQRIGMVNAWDNQTGSTSSGVSVAVLDTGIDYTHPELDDNYSPIGYDFVNNDDDPFDDNGHGTHVAGTIAATLDNGAGIAGMGNISIFAQKILGADGGGSYSGAIDAIYNATDLGADVLSNSWGGGAYSEALQDAVNYAVDNGALFIAAAGNDASSDPHYPAALDNVISISSTNDQDQLSSFSNYGDTIDLAAPGSNILSTMPSNSYDYLSGTSMATPHVSGLAALVWTTFSSYSAAQIERTLQLSAEDLGAAGYDIKFGHGLIDAPAALEGLDDYDVTVRLDQTSHDADTGEKNVTMIVSNSGTQSLTDVDVELYDNGTLHDSLTVSSLSPGSQALYNYSFTHLTTDAINLTAVAQPVSGENYTVDNRIVLHLNNALFNSLSDGDTVESGLVPVELLIPSGQDVLSADMILNSVKVSSISTLSDTEVTFFPVFSNGSNTIEYVLYWADGSFARTEVTINSINVSPLVDMSIGDRIDWVWGDLSGSYQMQNWTFIEWLSQTSMNATLDVEDRDSDGNIQHFTLWAEISLLNGYYLQTNFGWDGQHFSHLTGINSAYRNTTEYPNFIGFYEWNSYHTAGELSHSAEHYALRNSVSRDGLSMTTLQYSGVPTSYASGHLMDTTLYPQSAGISTTFDLANYQVNIENTTIITVENTGSLVIDSMETSIQLNDSSVTPTIVDSDGTISDLSSYDLYPGKQLSFRLALNFTTVSTYNLSFAINGYGITWQNSSQLISVEENIAPQFQYASEVVTYQFGETGNNLSWVFYDLDPANYTIYRNQTEVATGTWESGTNITKSVDGLPVGTYLYQIVVADRYGNLVSHNTTVYVDNTLPQLINNTTPASYLMGETGKELSWTFSDTNPDSYVVYRNGTAIASGQWQANSSITISIDGLAAGTYEFVIVVNDTAGATTTFDVVLTVDNLAPSLIDSTAPTDYIVGETGKELSWTFSDTNPDNYVVYRNGTAIASGQWQANSSITINIDGLAAGTYEFVIVVNDTAGVETNHSIIVTVEQVETSSTSTTTTVPSSSETTTSSTTSDEPSDTDDKEVSLTSIVALPRIVFVITLLGLSQLIYRRRHH